MPAFDEVEETATGAEAHGPLRICARFVDPLDAQMLATRLRLEGLDARVADENTVYANGPLALGGGGVRVMVPESQFDEAERIKAAIDSGEFSIDDDYDVGE